MKHSWSENTGKMQNYISSNFSSEESKFENASSKCWKNKKCLSNVKCIHFMFYSERYFSDLWSESKGKLEKNIVSLPLN